MGRRRRATIDKEEGGSSPQQEVPTGDPYERIRQLEEENKRLKEENEIFRKVLESKKLDADQVLVKFISMDGESTLEEIRELKRKANMNSGNSSMPPSSDRPWKKPRNNSLRPVTGRKSGGQPGHPGSTMKQPHGPDRVVMLYPAGCEECPKRDECESKGAFSCAEKRSVTDLKVEVTVTEYRALKRGPCPLSASTIDTGVFPEEARAFMQYGDGVAILAGMLDTFGAMSDTRIAEVINGLTGLEMASSTVTSLVQRCAEKVAPAMKPIADAIVEGPITNCDETGTRAVVEVQKKNGSDGEGSDEPETELVSRNVWIHGASNPSFTYLHASRIRGYDGMVEAGVLTRLKGTIIHDCWSPYWKFEWLRHGICNAHILRDLKGVIENRPDHDWPQEFIDLLITMKGTKEEAVASGMDRLPDDVLAEFHRRYVAILDKADMECPPPPQPPGKRGRPKLGKERALIERLREREAEACLFVIDFTVPFDNNLAERAFRFVKTKTKVSGCFRSIKGLRQYLDIMSYIDTARKHGVSAFEAMKMAFKGQWAEAIGLSARSDVGDRTGCRRYPLSSYSRYSIASG